MPTTAFDQELLDANLLGVVTLEELHQKEKRITNARIIALQKEPINGQLDYAHLKKIHAFLFSDIYIWAGKDCYEAGISAVFGKGTTLFTAHDRLPSVSKMLFGALRDEAYFEGLEAQAFAVSAAVFMNGLNILHPFREGNGRVQRLFMGYVAHKAGFVLDFTRITEQEMLKASIEGARGDLSHMEQLFLKALT
jgi:cell filamentation protein